ncbi:ankyrin repeat-containing domain protein [Dunaliella salina]|uniref:Ankyrin repeat-containing domain protein n=1 Tax=Dunaliella salina TaxID=3046 RepID=A0ABQ7GX55_DUNSA|nr:ankyrin repeat-containing domain protein [Dunaliella salina]|eukprot:KAF5839189.1 ankyrin repeat-containing domain protein [Dunaliella salina]
MAPKNSRAQAWADMYEACKAPSMSDSSTEAVIQRCLEIGANVNWYTQEEKDTALHAASACGSRHIVQVLLEKGALTEKANADGVTPLHVASRDGHVNIMRLLLAKGAVVDSENKWDGTPLHDACEYGHPDAVKVLLDQGADIEKEDGYKKTPLLYACEEGDTNCGGPPGLWRCSD